MGFSINLNWSRIAKGQEVAASKFSHLNHSLSHRPVFVKPDISKASSTGGKLYILKPSCERNGITPTPKESLSPTSGSKVPNSPLIGESNLFDYKASADGWTKETNGLIIVLIVLPYKTVMDATETNREPVIYKFPIVVQQDVRGDPDLGIGGLQIQESRQDYDEVFTPVARIEAIRLFLAYASFKDFVVCQMDVKSAFLYGKIEEEVYVCQPPGFEDPEFPGRVYKVEKALYGLHQAPRAYQDKYVDEILKKFGFSTVKTASTPMETSKPLMKDENAKDVDVHLYRSMIGSLMYLTSSRPDIIYLKGQSKLGLWYPKDSPFDLEAYTDSDYAGASLERKSTTGAANDEIQVRVVGLTYYYALPVNPTLYISCIKQFWATAKAKTVNEEVQIQDLVDGKKVIVTQTSVSRALQLKDVEGTECLLNATIFEQLTLMRYENLTQKLTFYKDFFSPQWKFLIHTILQCISAKTIAWNEFSSTMASVVICLAINQKFNFSKYIFDNMVKNLEGAVKFLMYPTFVQVFLDKQVEGMTKHKEIYVTPSHTKKVFANMKRGGKGFSGRAYKRLRKVGRSTQVVSSEDEGLGAQDDAFKQGRKIVDLDANAEVTLVDVAQGMNDDYLMFDTRVLDDQEVKVEKVVSTAEVTAASCSTLTTTSSSQTSQLPLAKDKGKENMIEPKKPLKKKDQILIDEEIAQKLQAQLNAELEEEEKLAKQREKDANIAEWDNVQAMIDADYELATRLQV
ncbi:retrovirus-related pol polyprotein from transposon TNT 1-94 [Tanacetum coccineum]